MSVKLEDSNIANYGGDGHRDARKDAASTEEEFRGAGQQPGVEIWRVENFGLKRWPKKRYGTFYVGDSYIVLNSFYPDKSSRKLNYNVHFWLGRETTQDEYGTAAYKTVELDDLLDDAPVQYREVQGYESREFRALFPRIRLLKGGVDSAFNEVKPEQFHPRLLHVKGLRETVTVRQVDRRVTSLNEGDCFVLDAGLELYQWNGPSANVHEKNKAREAIAELRDQRNGRPSSEIIEGLDEHEKFWTLLGQEDGKPPAKINVAVDDRDVFPVKKAMFRLSDESGKMRFKSVAEGADLDMSLLDKNDVFIVDVGTCVFTWVGEGASKQERKAAMKYASSYLDENERPITTPIVRVVQGGETLAFKNAFKTGSIDDDDEVKSDDTAKNKKKKDGRPTYKGVVKITVHEARQLQDVQMIGKQDPYVVIEMGKKHKDQTEVVKDGNTKGTWNHTVKWELTEKDHDITFTVKNANILVDKKIGRAVLDLAKIVSRGEKPQQQWLTLARGHDVGGQLSVTVQYFRPVRVSLVKARRLKNVQLLGKQDPYAKLILGQTTVKSTVKENQSKAPEWNETFEFNVAKYFEPDEEIGDRQVNVLTVQVWNANPVKDDPIGHAFIQLPSVWKNHRQNAIVWYDLKDKDDKPAGEIALKYD
eukprot:TRINITY_DN65915_c11_g6_i1.p1 TRINITY_DN65915_c11_g6~~TRINITY_DN65915_c11_g6_i1.p1  ORF type:complete len:647 (+),score=385.59 TRINITY_DN65915_c11_g6_i1:84-2024(+)